MDSPGGSHHSPTHWQVMGKKFPKSEVVFFCQILVVYTTVVAALVNLTLYRNDSAGNQLWVTLLSSCVGYMLPNPKIKRNGPGI